MRTSRVALLAVGIVVLVAGCCWYQYLGTPQHSLLLLADAVKAKDYETARYFVDDERIADAASKSFLDAAITHFTNEAKADDNPFSGIGVAAVQMMAPRIREAAKEQVKDAIKQALGGDATLTGGSKAQQLQLKAFSGLRIKDIVVSGRTAEVLIGGIPQPNPAQITEIHLRMAQIPNSRSWRIEEIPELAQAIAKMLDSQKISARASADVDNAVQPSDPAVTVSKPNRVLDQTTESVCRVDFQNSRVFLGNDWSAQLTNGRYAKQGDLQSEQVDLKGVSCFGSGNGERALVTTEWRGCGADCQLSGVTQVFELRDGHPVISQQIEFNSKAQGAGSSFDASALTLTVIGRSRYEADEGECCPKNLDVVTYRWQGQQFEQASYKRVPVPPS